MTTQQKYILLGIFVLTVLVSFVLGRLSAKTSRGNDITILSSQNIKNVVAEKEEDKAIEIRASSRGTKYYFSWCPSTFSEENTIYFASEEEAKDAGYEKATNCIDPE